MSERPPTPPISAAAAARARRSAVVDDRGASVRLARLRAGACPDPESDCARAVLARMRSSAATTWTSRYLQSVATLIALGLFGLTIALVVPLLPELPGIPAAVTVGGAIVALAAIGVLSVRIVLRPTALRNRVAYIDALLCMGRCPACGFVIGGAAVKAADGCAVCQECGAAWRMERLALVTLPEATGLGVGRLRTRLRSASQHTTFIRDARERRFAVGCGATLPRGAEWSMAQRWSFRCQSGFLSAMMALIALGAVVTVLTFLGSFLSPFGREDRIDAPWLAIIAPLSFVFVAPLLLLIPALASLATARALRTNACLSHDHCPACDTRLGDRGDPCSCPACGARWRPEDVRSVPRGGAPIGTGSEGD
ncbi:MAG: hypothetical protein SGJ09_01155 [Phycisphaerae bacterium]|nr:hypothetical protein [Phycisphaerae bacterium]